MGQTIFGFKFVDMPVTFMRSALIGGIVLAVVLTIAAVGLTNLLPLDALIAGIVGTVVHFLSGLVHQYGHFYAAKRTGYPSTGLVMWSILGTTRYPKDEVKLAPAIHIRRALGGPIASLILSLIIAVLAIIWLWSYSEFSRFIAVWLLLDNLVVFTIGALIPPITIGSFSNDGGTIWRHLRQK